MSISLPVGAALIAVGLLGCFFGYRFFKGMVGITGFVIGALLVGTLVSVRAPGNETAILLGALVGGIIGAFLLLPLYSVALFVSGAAAGFLAGMFLAGAANLDYQLPIAIVMGILGGVATIMLHKLAIIISTAFIGSAAVVLGIAGIFSKTVNPWHQLRDPNLLVVVPWIALGIFGAIKQYRTPTKDHPQRHRSKEPKE